MQPVVLAVYGDHLPALGTSVLQAIGVDGDKGKDSPESALLMHRTPGLIWTTGGRALTRTGGITGMNYFIAYTLKSAGISHPYYTGFLLKAHDAMPVINHHVICLPDGSPVQTIPQASRALFNDYELLQYDMVFGRQYAAKSLFPEMK